MKLISACLVSSVAAQYLTTKGAPVIDHSGPSGSLIGHGGQHVDQAAGQNPGAARNPATDNGVAELRDSQYTPNKYTFRTVQHAQPSTFYEATSEQISKGQCQRLCAVSNKCTAYFHQDQLNGIGNCYFTNGNKLYSGQPYWVYDTQVKQTAAGHFIVDTTDGTDGHHEVKRMENIQTATSVVKHRDMLFVDPVRPQLACRRVTCEYKQGRVHVYHDSQEIESLAYNGVLTLSHLSADHNCQYDSQNQRCACTCAESGSGLLGR